MNDHSRFIRRAIELSAQAFSNGNHPFGAVLVLGGKIVLEAENTVQSESDVTRHAEINLVSQASRQLSLEDLRRCTLYASTEPCAMCAGAIYWAGITCVIYGCSAEALHQIAGPSINLGCRKVFECCYEGVEVVGPIEEELACAVHMDCWPHPS